MRLLVRAPPPEGWRPGWTPGAVVRRCRCGAAIVARSVAYTRCGRGCIKFPPPAPAPVPRKPLPPARERANFADLIVDLRLLESDFVRAVRKGRRVPPEKLERAFTAMELLWELCPGHGEEILAALPWLTKQAGKGRAA